MGKGGKKDGSGRRTPARIKEKRRIWCKGRGGEGEGRTKKGVKTKRSRREEQL
jgi:hypothetical protein